MIDELGELDTRPEVCRRIRELRKSTGQTQKTLAMVSGVPRETLCAIENGRMPQRRTVLRLKRGLDFLKADTTDLVEEPRLPSRVYITAHDFDAHIRALYPDKS